MVSKQSKTKSALRITTDYVIDLQVLQRDTFSCF